MFQLIFGIQAVVYLLIVPFVKQYYVFGYDAPLLYGIIACTSLFLGYALNRRPFAESQYMLVANRWLIVLMCILAIMYCYVSYSFGLQNRRLGSEYIADLFSSLPLWALLITRVYEILVVPVFVIVIKSGEYVTRLERFALTVTMLISIPFMGLADSRGRLLVIGLSILIFFNARKIFRLFKSSARFYLAIISVMSLFAVVSIERARSYSQLSEYYIAELVNRLDGLNLVKSLIEFSELPFWGTYDWNMFRILISKIPFIEEARYLKMTGKTSTKQYILQDVLGFRQLDDSNSMITDPLYFGGGAMLIVSFVLLGHVIKTFDKSVNSGDILSHPVKSALIFAFGLSFIMIEADLIGSLTAMIQIALVFLVVVWLGCRRVGVAPGV